MTGWRPTPEACPECRHVHLPDDTVAVGRFRPNGPMGFRARRWPTAPLRPTRDRAERDACRLRQGRVP